MSVNIRALLEGSDPNSRSQVKKTAIQLLGPFDQLEFRTTRALGEKF